MAQRNSHRTLKVVAMEAPYLTARQLIVLLLIYSLASVCWALVAGKKIWDDPGHCTKLVRTDVKVELGEIVFTYTCQESRGRVS